MLILVIVVSPVNSLKPGNSNDNGFITVTASYTTRWDTTLPTFAAACAAILDKVPQAHFLLIGEARTDASAVRALNAARTEYRLEGRLHLLGERKDLPVLYPQMSVLMLTSRYEGFPNVIIEAMASGIPVVSTMSGGPQTIITDRVNGYLAPVGDAMSLAAAAVHCILDPSSSADITRTAYARVRSDFDWQTVVRQMVDVYRRTLEEHETIGIRPGRNSAGITVLLDMLAQAASSSMARSSGTAESGSMAGSGHSSGLVACVWTTLRRLRSALFS
jgi:glycogen synthase